MFNWLEESEKERERALIEIKAPFMGQVANNSDIHCEYSFLSSFISELFLFLEKIRIWQWKPFGNFHFHSILICLREKFSTNCMRKQKLSPYKSWPLHTVYAILK